MAKKLLYIALIVILLVIINGLIHSIYDLWGKRDLLSSAQQTLNREKEKNEKLKNNLKIAQTQEFIESEARNKLFLSKEGEKEVLIPKKEVKSAEKKEPEKPNWQKWLGLFF